jgi:hypothetical protein
LRLLPLRCPARPRRCWHMKQKTASHAMHEMLLDCMVQLHLLRRCYLAVV